MRTCEAEGHSVRVGGRGDRFFYTHLSTAFDIEQPLEAPHPISLQQCLFSTLFVPLYFLHCFFPPSFFFFKYTSCRENLTSQGQPYNSRSNNCEAHIDGWVLLHGSSIVHVMLLRQAASECRTTPQHCLYSHFFLSFFIQLWMWYCIYKCQKVKYRKKQEKTSIQLQLQ